MSDSHGIMQDPLAPSFLEKLADFVSAMFLVVLTIFTAWHYSLPLSRSLRSAPPASTERPVGKQAAAQLVQIGQDSGSDFVPARRKSLPVAGQ